MDRIPIGEPPPQPDNVVRLPGAEAAEPPEAAEPDEAMSYEEAIAADADEPDDDEHGATTPGSQVAGLLEQGVRVGAGLFAAGATALAEALRSTMPEDQEEVGGKDPATTIAGAGLGAAVTAAEVAAGAARQVADTIGPAITWLVEPRFAKDAGEVAAGAARVLDGRWKASQAEMVEAATSFLGALVPEIAQGLADQVDLTALVRERVDVNAIVEDVDIDRILERVDLDAMIDRIDIDEIVARVDVNACRRPAWTSTAIIARTDLDRRSSIASTSPASPKRSSKRSTCPALVRESSGIMANETVQTVRVQGMNADRLVAHVVDRVLRREARDLLPAERRLGEGER